MYEVNLLPSEKRVNSYSIGKRKTLAVILFIIILLMLGMYSGFLFQYTELKQKAVELEAVLQEKSAALQNIKSVQQDKLEAQKTINNLENLVENRITWSGLLLDLDLIQPIDLKFTELKMYQISPGKERKDIQGFADVQSHLTTEQRFASVVHIFGEAGSTDSIVNLYKELRKKSYLQEVRLKSVDQKIKCKKVKFFISAVLIKEINYAS